VLSVALVRNLYDVLCKSRRAILLGSRVLVAECLVLRQPAEHSSLVRHSVIPANRSQRPTRSNLRTNMLSDCVVIVTGTAHHQSNSNEASQRGSEKEAIERRAGLIELDLMS